MSKFVTTVTLSTPFFDGDQDLVYPLQLASKKEVRKVERALIRGLVHLGNMSDDALDNPEGVFAGTDPQEVHMEYLVMKDGKKWARSLQEWPNQTNEARAYLKGLLDQLMAEAGHKAARTVRGKGKKGA